MAVGRAIACSSKTAAALLVPEIFIRHPPPYYPSRASGGWCRRERAYRHFSSQAVSSGTEHSKCNGEENEDSDSDEKKEGSRGAEVEWKRGVPQVLVPLPTPKRQVLFSLRPLDSTVGDLVHMIRREDPAVKEVALATKENIRIASSNSIASLIEEDFKLKINDNEFYVKAPDRGIEDNQLERLTEIRSLVSQLYTTLNAGENTVRLEQQLQTELETLKDQLEPLEKKRRELDLVAGRKANALTWVGLGLMSVQFGILARLTWWEYSWDIMEPVTYFVTYGTSMAAYAYFVLTRQDYVLPDVRDRQHLLHVHKKAAKVGLNLDEYNRLKESVARVQHDLSRLRDPLSRIPVQPYIRPVSEESAQGHSASALLNKVRCTGSIISDNWVLSAAHCTVVDGRLVRASEMAVVAGVVDFNQSQSQTRQVRYAKHIFPHPSFEELKIAGSDIALIKLDRPFEIEGMYVSTIPVSGDPFPVNSDISCTASGWGDTKESSTNSRLHKLNVIAVQSKTVCHGLSPRERKNMICLRNKGGAGLCDGDSGGPLICGSQYNRVVGVAHQVYIEKVNYKGPSDMDCGSNTLVHTYMFVCPFLDWMKGLVPEVPSKPKKCFTLNSTQDFDEDL